MRFIHCKEELINTENLFRIIKERNIYDQAGLVFEFYDSHKSFFKIFESEDERDAEFIRIGSQLECL